MRNDTFRTVIQIQQQRQQMQHKESIMCIGSCFADNMGEMLASHKFRTFSNPYGVLFNPVSIAGCIRNFLLQEPLDAPFFHNGIWQSFLFHGSFSHPNRDICVQNMQKAQQQAHDFAQTAKWLIISLGSNMVYREQTNGRIVANCHKMAADTFKKEALSFSVMQKPLEEALSLFKQMNQQLHCIITVSPIRYIKNNFEENSLGKAHLRLLSQYLCDNYSWISYFPAFEIMTDDLRDYRFYQPDKIHPSLEAVNYIWDCFSETWFNEETRQLNHEIETIQKAFNHKPLFPQTEEWQHFCQQNLNAITSLQQLHPYLQLDRERAHFEVCKTE